MMEENEQLTDGWTTDESPLEKFPLAKVSGAKISILSEFSECPALTIVPETDFSDKLLENVDVIF